jgi:hypothetical protein
MKYSLLGKSRLRVSEAAPGTMTFGDDWGWGSPKHEGRKSIPAARAADLVLTDRRAGRGSAFHRPPPFSSWPFTRRFYIFWM